jgi:hypothetical protein
MTPEIATKIVASLDAELERRRRVRDAQEEARWREESGDDPVVFARRYLDRFLGRIGAKSAEEAAEIVMASVGDDADRARLERVEEFAEWIVRFAEKVQLLEARRSDVEAGIERRRFKPAIQVESVTRLLSHAKPRPDPAAPRPAERTGRRGEAPLVQPAEAGPVWQKGMVLTFNPRTHEGMLRAADGREIPLEGGALMRSGLVSLIPGQRAEFLVVAGVVNTIKAASPRGGGFGRKRQMSCLRRVARNGALLAGRVPLLRWQVREDVQPCCRHAVERCAPLHDWSLP